MKLVAVWLAALGLAIATASSCSINHKTSEFACEVRADCAAGRICIDGYCVVVQLDAGSIAAPGPDALDGVCPSQCTSCNTGQHSCTIDCSSDPDACKQQVVCPDGWACNVACSTAGSCNQGVSCDAASSCTVACSGQGSCQGIACGDGACNVTCSGRNSCNGVTCSSEACTIGCGGVGACKQVSCGSSCACEVDCNVFADCAVACPNGCDGAFGGCNANRTGCNTCQ